MRAPSLFAILSVIALCAPQALACQLREPPPIPQKVFWQDASDVGPGETAVEVSFVRYSRLTDPAHPRTVIIEGCGPSHRVYRVVRVLAGDAKEHQEILVPAFHDFGGSSAILIGRFSTQQEREGPVLGRSTAIQPCSSFSRGFRPNHALERLSQLMQSSTTIALHRHTPRGLSMGETSRLASIPLSALSRIAIGIDRPEDVVVSRDGRVFASDHQSTVAEIQEDGSFIRMGPRGGAPNGINMDAQGRIIIANFGAHDREPGPLQRFDPATGKHETLLSEVDGRTLTASNYPVIDSAGNIWCANSTSAAAWSDALDGRADGFVYVLRADGSSAIVADSLRFPNGLALSADERFLFCAQTTGGDVLRFPILAGARLGLPERHGPKLGLVANRKPNPKSRPPRWLAGFLGYTDGIGFDADGNLWVTLVAAHKIVAITPRGRKFTVLHDPAGDLLNSPTNITWSGEDMCDLYIGTIGRNYVLKARSPVPGQRMIHQR